MGSLEILRSRRSIGQKTLLKNLEDAHWEEQETNDVEDGTDCENYEEHVSPRGNKRRRMNGEGHSGATEGNGHPEPTLLKVKTLPRGADG